MKTSKQVEQEIEEAKARYEFLTTKRTELEDELDEVEKELREYRSSSITRGRIWYKQQELETIRLIEESDSLPIPVFKEEGWGNDSNVRVFKVTPKRIYIRKIDKERVTIYEDFINKDGSSYNLKGINIPETLKVWEEYLTKEKEVK